MAKLVKTGRGVMEKMSLMLNISKTTKLDLDKHGYDCEIHPQIKCGESFFLPFQRYLS